MPRFRRIPLELEAWQVGSKTPAPSWLTEALQVGTVRADHHRVDRLGIVTLEGFKSADPGDWIIRGVAGELYPCQADIFPQIYEPVEDLVDEILGSVDPIATLAMIGNGRPTQRRDLSHCPDGDGGYG